MSSPHLENKWIGGIADLHILFQTPQKDARIIGEIGEYSSFWRLTMVAKFMLKRFGKENPLIAPQESDRYNFCSIPYKIQKHFPPLYQDKPIANVSLITTDIKSKNSSERPVKIHKKIKLKNI
jgi:hypothetical protein